MVPEVVLWKGAGVFHEPATASTIPADLALLDTSWWYDWASYSVPGLTTKPSTPGIEYVPMMWGDWIDDPRWGSATGDNTLGGNSASSIGSATTLLGFNEPDIEEQADMTVARALALWPDLEATGARLGSPAPSGTPDGRGLTWLADFMDGAGVYVPRVDFICAHWYTEYNLGFSNIADFLDYLHTTYPTKPIWLSEVGSLSGGQSANAALMPTVMSVLATRPWVERVAWYVVSRNAATGYDGTRLTTTSGTLSTSGTAYASYPDRIPYEEAEATVPGAPTGLGATAADASAALSWAAPASNGGAAITDYMVQYRTTAGPGSWNTFSHSANTATSIVVTGLTNATGYDFQVAAVNSVGAGAYSTTASATPASGGGGTAWSYDFTDDADGAMPSTLTYFGGSLTGRIASGHFMCDVDWFFTKVYDNGLIPDQTATTHLIAAEVVFVTAGTGGTHEFRFYFAGNADMTSFDSIVIRQDGSWNNEYDGGGVAGTPNLPAFTTGVPTRIHVTYNEVTAAAEIFVNDVSAATTSFAAWPKTGTRAGFMVAGNADVWVRKFYYGPQSAGVPGSGGTTTVPGAPTGLGATAGNAQASLVWTAPASNGGAAITNYVVQYRTSAGPGSWNTFSHSTSTATSIVVTGLTNGTGYDFQVAAVNSVGTGAYSSTASATPAVAAAYTDRGRKWNSAGVTGTMIRTSDAFTPAANVYVSVGFSWQCVCPTGGNSGTVVVTDTFGDTGGTAWVLQASCVRAASGGGGYLERSEVYTRKIGTAPASGTITVTPTEDSSFSTSSNENNSWAHFLEWKPEIIVVGTGSGVGDVRQTKGPTTYNVGLDADPAADSVMYAVLQQDYTPSAVFPTLTGYTALFEDWHTTFQNGSSSYVRDGDEDTTVGFTNISVDANCLGAAVEFRRTALPGTFVQTWHTSGQGGFNSGNNAPAVTLTIPDWSVTAGDLLVVYCGGELSDVAPLANPVFTVSGGAGLTWTQQVQARNTNVFNAQAAIYTAVAPSTATISGIQVSTPSALTISYGAQRIRGQHASPFGITGSASTNAGVSGTLDLTLPSTPALSSYMGACIYINTDDNSATKGIDHGASDGWTELMDNGAVMNGTGRWGLMEVQGKLGLTVNRSRWDNTALGGYTTYSYAACALEIKPA